MPECTALVEMSCQEVAVVQIQQELVVVSSSRVHQLETQLSDDKMDGVRTDAAASELQLVPRASSKDVATLLEQVAELRGCMDELQSAQPVGSWHKSFEAQMEALREQARALGSTAPGAAGRGEADDAAGSEQNAASELVQQVCHIQAQLQAVQATVQSQGGMAKLRADVQQLLQERALSAAPHAEAAGTNDAVARLTQRIEALAALHVASSAPLVEPRDAEHGALPTIIDSPQMHALAQALAALREDVRACQRSMVDRVELASMQDSIAGLSAQANRAHPDGANSPAANRIGAHGHAELRERVDALAEALATVQIELVGSAAAANEAGSAHAMAITQLQTEVAALASSARQSPPAGSAPHEQENSSSREVATLLVRMDAFEARNRSVAGRAGIADASELSARVEMVQEMLVTAKEDAASAFAAADQASSAAAAAHVRANAIAELVAALEASGGKVAGADTHESAAERDALHSAIAELSADIQRLRAVADGAEGAQQYAELSAAVERMQDELALRHVSQQEAEGKFTAALANKQSSATLDATVADAVDFRITAELQQLDAEVTEAQEDAAAARELAVSAAADAQNAVAAVSETQTGIASRDAAVNTQLGQLFVRLNGVQHSGQGAAVAALAERVSAMQAALRSQQERVLHVSQPVCDDDGAGSSMTARLQTLSAAVEELQARANQGSGGADLPDASTAGHIAVLEHQMEVLAQAVDAHEKRGNGVGAFGTSGLESSSDLEVRSPLSCCAAHHVASVLTLMA